MGYGDQSNKPKRWTGLLAAAILLAGLFLTPRVSAGTSPARKPAQPDVPASSQSGQAAASSAEQTAPPAPQADTAQSSEPTGQTASPDAPPAVQTPVEDSYFDDAVFLGDSRTEGFHLYSGLKTGQYLYAVGATVQSVFTKATEKTGHGKVPLLDALDALDFSKVYIMLGVNELGWPKTAQFHDQYVQVVDRIRDGHPGADIILQSLPPVSAKQEAKGSYVNNRRIEEFNEVIRQVAEETGCIYLDVAEAVTGEDGCLPADETTDGVHLNTKGCGKWLEYLKDHPVSLHDGT